MRNRRHNKTSAISGAGPLGAVIGPEACGDSGRSKKIDGCDESPFTNGSDTAKIRRYGLVFATFSTSDGGDRRFSRRGIWRSRQLA